MFDQCPIPKYFSLLTCFHKMLKSKLMPPKKEWALLQKISGSFLQFLIYFFKK